MFDGVRIRKLIQADIHEFFNLRLESLKKHPSSYLTAFEEEKVENFEKLFSDNDVKNVIFGAFLENKMIGIVGIYQERAKKIAHKCNIWGMYIQADQRGKGIAKKLIEAAIKYGKETLKCSIIGLSVEMTNLAAKNLYESYGFKVWGIENKAICVGQEFYDEAHMSLFFEKTNN